MYVNPDETPVGDTLANMVIFSLSTNPSAIPIQCVYTIHYCHKRISNTLKNTIGREGVKEPIKIQNVYMIANGRALFFSQPIRRPETVPKAGAGACTIYIKNHCAGQ